MKNLICFITACFFASTSIIAFPADSSSTTLNVFAPSGLKLRAFPDIDAEVLDIVKFGDQVALVNTFGYPKEKEDRIDWIDGHWILVNYDGIVGYLFDGYLSKLPFPHSKEELIQDGYFYPYTLSEYFERLYKVKSKLVNSENAKIYFLENDIKIKRITKESNWSTTLEIPDLKIGDVLNLMRSMLPDKKMREQFEKNLIFIKGKNDKIIEVKVNMGDSVVIKKKPDGTLMVKASGYVGC